MIELIKFQIVGGQTSANAATGALSTQAHFCGRELRPANDEAWTDPATNADAAVCSEYNLRVAALAFNNIIELTFTQNTLNDIL